MRLSLFIRGGSYAIAVVTNDNGIAIPLVLQMPDFVAMALSGEYSLAGYATTRAYETMGYIRTLTGERKLLTA